MAQKPKAVVDRVVAAVGDKIIMLSDVEEMTSRTLKENPDVPADEVRCVMVQQLLTNNLLVNEAERDSLKLTDEEVETSLSSRLDQILQMMGGDVEQFNKYYSMTPQQMKDRMRDDMRNQMLAQRMQNKIMDKVTITPNEVLTFFNKIPKDSLPFFNSMVEVSEIIVLAHVSKLEEEEALKKTEEIRRRILEQKEEFAKLAEQFSEDPGSGRQGGDLGWQNRGTFVPEFESAAYKLKPNELSQPIKTKFGYHLIQTLERRGNSIHCRHILVKPTITPNDRQKAFNKLDSIRTLLLRDSIPFREAVRRHSEDDNSKQNGGQVLNPKTGEPSFETGELDANLFFILDTMLVGGISSPMEYSTQGGDPGFRIVRLNSRSEPHQANLKDDYHRIMTATLEEKKSRATIKWVMDKIGSNYIKIDPEYANCPNLKTWTAKAKQ